MLTEAGRYLSTRLLQWRIAMLWLLLVAALASAQPRLIPLALTLQAGYLGIALALLRLWDDLADIRHDRAYHPERVLAASRHLRAYGAVLTIGLVCLALPLIGDIHRLTIYGVLVAMLAWLYHGRFRFGVPRALRNYVVLCKYPVLVFLAGAPPSGRSWLVGLVLYALLAVHDWLDDAELRTAPAGELFVGGASGVAIVSLVFLIGGMPG